MPSQALDTWNTTRTSVLDGMLTAVKVARASRRVRPDAVQHLTQSYAVLLSAEFQGCCKDLHRECAGHFVSLTPPAIRDVIEQQFLSHRLLDRGNPNPGNIGADFNRFGLKLFDEATRTDPRLVGWRQQLE